MHNLLQQMMADEKKAKAASAITNYMRPNPPKGTRLLPGHSLGPTDYMDEGEDEVLL